MIRVMRYKKTTEGKTHRKDFSFVIIMINYIFNLIFRLFYLLPDFNCTC